MDFQIELNVVNPIEIVSQNPLSVEFLSKEGSQLVFKIGGNTKLVQMILFLLSFPKEEMDFAQIMAGDQAPEFKAIQLASTAEVNFSLGSFNKSGTYTCLVIASEQSRGMFS